MIRGSGRLRKCHSACTLTCSPIHNELGSPAHGMDGPRRVFPSSFFHRNRGGRGLSKSAKSSRAIKELEKFFEATNSLEPKTLQFLGWRGPAKAIRTTKKVSL
jgi:hypothetical protein